MPPGGDVGNAIEDAVRHDTQVKIVGTVFTGAHQQGFEAGALRAVDIAHDVVALRQSLGYEQWNLYGSSFSTSVMLLVMEADRGGTRALCPTDPVRQ